MPKDSVMIFDQMVRLFEVLGKDLESIASEPIGKDIQYTRRKIIRTVSSIIDGLLSSLKNDVLEIHKEWSEKIMKERVRKEMPYLWERMQPRLTPEELVLLMEGIPEVDDKGKAHLRPAYLPFDRNFRFSFRCFSKVFKSDYEPDYSDVGWNLLQESIKVRNRVLHLKTADDLKISDEEISNLDKALKWMMKSHSEAMREFDKLIKELDASYTKLSARPKRKG